MCDATLARPGLRRVLIRADASTYGGGMEAKFGLRNLDASSSFVHTSDDDDDLAGVCDEGELILSIKPIALVYFLL